MPSKDDSEKWVIPYRRIRYRPANIIWAAAVVWLLMDRYRFPVWACASIMTFFFLIFIGVLCICNGTVEKDVVFKSELEEESTSPFKKLWNRGRMS